MDHQLGHDQTHLGCLIMTHLDVAGFVLSPRVAPTQVAIVLIRKNEQQRDAVVSLDDEVAGRIPVCGVPVEVDAHPNMRPGAKYSEWARSGVPLLLEIGPKDAAKRAVFAARGNGGPRVSIPFVNIYADNNFELAVERISTASMHRSSQPLPNDCRNGHCGPRRMWRYVRSLRRVAMRLTCSLYRGRAIPKMRSR